MAQVVFLVTCAIGRNPRDPEPTQAGPATVIQDTICFLKAA